MNERSLAIGDGVAGATAPQAAWQEVQSSIGGEAEALIAAALAGDGHLRTLEREWAHRLIDRLAVDVRLVGAEHIATDEQYIVVALHEGFADAIVLLELGIDLRFAARSELLSWPVLGDYLAAADHITVDPERPVAGMRNLLRWSEKVLASGDSVAVFAQGTILGIETALQAGAFEVAARSGTRILPVVIAGTHHVWEHPFSSKLRLGCSVYVEVLEPITVEDAETSRTSTERTLKTKALGQPIQPRRFDPDRDGIWPGYAYDIDPAFPDVADRVAELRAAIRIDTAS